MQAQSVKLINARPHIHKTFQDQDKDQGQMHNVQFLKK